MIDLIEVAVSIIFFKYKVESKKYFIYVLLTFVLW